MTDPHTPAPPAADLLAGVGRALGARSTVRDAVPARKDSHVWRLALPNDVHFYLKVCRHPLAYEGETFALRTAADGAENHLREAEDRVTSPQQQLVRDLAADLRVLPALPLAFTHGDAWDRNLLWSRSRRQAGWIDFERSHFAPAVQDFVMLACSTWVDRPELRTACLQGYGRDLTPEEEHALRCLAALDAVSCLHWGPRLGDHEVTARGKRTLDRLTTGVFA
ncbi:phosphotransferase [Streptomyces silaceus]|uniref:phosphotransferase n=1 Tax=Streptomyces silaceus TaxID=545123 RepID=UPI0007C7AC25|nr:phosphotransferase [Streptomyces silaceus]